MSKQDLVFTVVILVLTLGVSILSFAEEETGYQCCTPMGQYYFNPVPIKLVCFESIYTGIDGVEYKYVYCRNRDYMQINMPDNVG